MDAAYGLGNYNRKATKEGGRTELNCTKQHLVDTLCVAALWLRSVTRLGWNAMDRIAHTPTETIPFTPRRIDNDARSGIWTDTAWTTGQTDTLTTAQALHWRFVSSVSGTQ